MPERVLLVSPDAERVCRDGEVRGCERRDGERASGDPVVAKSDEKLAPIEADRYERVEGQADQKQP
jgi:hypothetical protein